MPDYAGAAAAIRAMFTAGWVSGGSPRTPVQFQNSPPPQTPWPPEGIPWVYLEVIPTTSELLTFGVPGDHLWLYKGNIFIHVFVPIDYGISDIETLAVQAGEIFRAQNFYNNSNGSVVRTIAPFPSGGASNADNGNWFGIDVVCPFEYQHRG